MDHQAAPQLDPATQPIPVVPSARPVPPHAAPQNGAPQYAAAHPYAATPPYVPAAPVPYRPAAPGVPGTVTAVRVLLGLNAGANAISLMIAVIGAMAASSMASAFGGTDLDAGEGVTVGTLITALWLLAAWAVVSIAVDIWAIVTIGRASRTARIVVSALPVANVLVQLAFLPALGSDALGGLVFAVPLGVALLVLLWVPESSKAFFDGCPVAVPAQRPGPAC